MDEAFGVIGEGVAAVASEPLRVDYEYTLNWAPILDELGASLLVSTYQAGKIVAVGRAAANPDDSGLRISCHNFEKAMGIAVSPDRLAVVAHSVIWILRDAPAIAPRLDPLGTYDACYLTRGALYTGAMNGHELARSGEELWAVNTLFSCLCTLDDRHSFIPRWRPPFITAYAPVADRRDRLRCGVAVVELTTGRTIGFLEFRTGIEEIFDVQLAHGVRSPMIQGPYPEADRQAPIWLAPASAAG